MFWTTAATAASYRFRTYSASKPETLRASSLVTALVRPQDTSATTSGIETTFKTQVKYVFYERYELTDLFP